MEIVGKNVRPRGRTGQALVPDADVGADAFSSLTPIIRVDDVDYRLMSTDIAAIPRSLLGNRIANVELQRTDIINTIDFLLQGF